MESVVSMAVLSVVVVAVGSALVIASRAIPGENNPTDNLLKASRKLDWLHTELCCAVTVTQPAPTAFEFTVADRSGDGQRETIRYAWSGTSGDPMTRQYNGGNAAVFLDNVHHVEIGYDLRAVADTGQKESESAERLLIGHDDSGGNVLWRVVEPLKWPGQYFRPALGPEAVGWRITRLRVKAQKAGPVDGSFAVVVSTADRNCLPSKVVLAMGMMMESSLTGQPTWQEFTFPGLPRLEPETGACLVLMGASGLQAAWVRFESGGVDTPDAHYISSVNKGMSWTSDTSMDMLFEVYGTVTVTDGLKHYYLRSVALTLQVGDDPAARVTTAIPLLNQPEVALPAGSSLCVVPSL